MSSNVTLCGKYLVPSDFNVARARIMERGFSPEAALTALYILGHEDAKRSVEVLLPTLTGSEEKAKEIVEKGIAELVNKLGISSVHVHDCHVLGDALVRIGAIDMVRVLDVRGYMRRLVIGYVNPKCQECIFAEVSIDVVLENENYVTRIATDNIIISFITQRNKVDVDLDAIRQVAEDATVTVDISGPTTIRVRDALSKLQPMVEDNATRLTVEEIVALQIVNKLVNLFGTGNVKLRNIEISNPFSIKHDGKQTTISINPYTAKLVNHLVLTSLATSEKVICVQVGDDPNRLDEVRRSVSSTEQGIVYVIGVDNGKFYIPRIFITRILARKITRIFNTDPDVIMAAVANRVKIGKSTYYEIRIDGVDPFDICPRVVEPEKKETPIEALRQALQN